MTREHGIDENPRAVDLEQKAAVAEPCDAEAGCGWDRPFVERTYNRKRRRRSTLASAEEEVGQNPDRASGHHRRDAEGVVKFSAAVLLRGEHALEAASGISWHPEL